MNLFKFKNSYRYLWKILAVVVVIVIASCSITIDSVDQPSSINGGQTLSVTLNCTVKTNSTGSDVLMVAVLVPKVWNVSKNGTISFTSDITTGSQAMTVIPAGTAAPQAGGLDWPTLLANKIGNGGNLQNGCEWVAFYANSAVSFGSGVTFGVTVHIQMKASNDNLLYKPGYVVADNSDGLSDQQYYNVFVPGTCFTVNGTGDLLDYCNPQFSTVDSHTSLDNDIITISFDGGVASTPLDSVSQIYLCATGITADGKRLTVCTPNSQTQMSSLGLKRWRIDMWPRKFFGLADNQQLTGLEYFFTDATGNTKVGYGGGTSPFTYTFKCQ
jgi:hypothetical protein